MSACLQQFRKKLSEIKTTEPVFAGSRARWSSDIEFEPVQTTTDNEPNESDDIDTMLAKRCFSESFNKYRDRYECNYDSAEMRAKEYVVSILGDFIAKHINAKKPYQTALYKFYRNNTHINKPGFMDVVYPTYKYLLDKVENNDAGIDRDIHITNGLKILEVIRNRFEKAGK